ncbi:MAG: hypothetical protein ABSG14_03960 [Verrucomicrobiia bacterium]
MARSTSGNGKGRGTKANVIVWTLLVVLVLTAGVLALNVTQRFHRVVQETNQVRTVVQEAVKRQEMIVKAPARKEFSAAFLQMAFGDNPQLLEQIKASLGKALGENPTLAQGDVAMMLVTYRAEGELRDVAIHIFGNLMPEKLPAFSAEGYWKSQLPDNFFKMGQSMLATLGREVVILASPEAEKRQRDLLESILNNRYDTVQNYLHDPVSFIVVIPEPGLLFTDRFRPYMAAALIKGKISLDEARAEMVALSMDPQKAQELAQLLSDTRMMAVGIARVRYGSSVADSALEQLSRAQIVADGPAVKMTVVLPSDVIERGLPRVVRALSKGIGRIQRGPGYPS